MLDDVFQPGGDEHERRISVGERAHDPRPPLDLAVYPLDPVVGSDDPPVLRWELRVGQGLFEPGADGSGRRREPHIVELGSDLLRLAGTRFARLLRVNRLEHPSDRISLRHREPLQHVAVEVHSAAVVAGLREHLIEGTEHSRSLHLTPVTRRMPERPRSFSRGKNLRHESADSA